MSVFEGVLETLQENKQRRLKGDIISIPWSLPRLSRVLPGIEQGRYNLISASPKAGKCLGENTLVKLASGQNKKVQELEVGDRLLNPFGEPNIITSTIS